jgi:hypothetical protein
VDAKHPDALKYFSDPTIAYLSDITYNGNCTIDHALSSGSGSGTRTMINTAFNIVWNQCPHVKFIRFNDQSRIPCKDGRELNILSYYIAVHGKTWYEYYFDAFIDPSLEHVYASGIQRFKQPINDDILVMLLEKIENVEISKSQSLNDFFTMMKNDKPEFFCDKLLGWLPDFVNRVLGFNPAGSTPWFVKRPNTITQEYSIQLLQSKDKSYTVGGVRCKCCTLADYS